ncbi:MAG: hypothetical protein ACOYOO_10080, partial [Saprospiraceae bacterium]
ISLREIAKMMCLTKKYSASEGGKGLFAQLQNIIWRFAPNNDLLDSTIYVYIRKCKDKINKRQPFLKKLILVKGFLLQR